MTRVLRAVAAALVLVALSAAGAMAHPLGNFTINHATGIRVEPDRVLLDVVIDEAEIPAFQATRRFDADADGRLSDAELAGLRARTCLEVGRALSLTAGGARLPLTLTATGATLPPGNGGLPTLRLVCGFEAPASLAGGGSIALRDDFEAARIGWREMTAVGSGVTVVSAGILAASPSARLTAYPASLASAPDVRELSFDVGPGGPILADLRAPDAAPVEPVTVDEMGAMPAVGETVTGSNPGPAPRSAQEPGPGGATVAGGALVPGGAEALPDLLRRAPVNPLIALGALLLAAALGAGHALTPGHGKTLMAAYLVGTRGGPRHAVALGLAVAVSHTAGILILALVVLAAERSLPVDVVVRAAPVVAAVSIVVVGGWMLLGEVRRRLDALRAHALAQSRGLEHGHAHDVDHGHVHEHRHAHAHEPATDSLEHRHGGIVHSHAPAPGARVTWRSLFLLGLAGGLVPSASALLLLLGTIAAGRPAWGAVLVAAFGLGMAGVMTAIGLTLVYARARVERSSRRIPVARIASTLPLATGTLVLILGVVLTTQAIAAARLG